MNPWFLVNDVLHRVVDLKQPIIKAIKWAWADEMLEFHDNVVERMGLCSNPAHWNR